VNLLPLSSGFYSPLAVLDWNSFFRSFFLSGGKKPRFGWRGFVRFFSFFESRFSVYSGVESDGSPRGDGGKQKPGTNSISTGTKIVPVGKKNLPFIKNDESPTPTYPETRKSSNQKVKNEYKS